MRKGKRKRSAAASKKDDEKRKGIVKELFSSVKKNFKRMGVIVKGLYETLSADLVDMQKFSSVNGGYKHILTVIDNFSKFAWAIPLKRKTMWDVSNAMEKVLSQIKTRSVKNIHTDEGTDFFNSAFRSLMDKYKINHYHTYSALKCPMVERFNRTLRHLMHPQFVLRKSNRWIDILPDLLKRYNTQMKHRTIRMTPIEATNPSREAEIKEKIYNNYKTNYKTPKFKKGDFVRISRQKMLFEKGYTNNFSNEIFIVREVKLTNPRTYLLEDIDKEEVAGRFYEDELMKTKYPDSYIVEKVVRKNKNKWLVKYYGIDGNHWINKKDYL